jgi:hypothetical protein
VLQHAATTRSQHPYYAERHQPGIQVRPYLTGSLPLLDDAFDKVYQIPVDLQQGGSEIRVAIVHIGDQAGHHQTEHFVFTDQAYMVIEQDTKPIQGISCFQHASGYRAIPGVTHHLDDGVEESILTVKVMV